MTNILFWILGSVVALYTAIRFFFWWLMRKPKV
jgi:hypothetical protein